MGLFFLTPLPPYPPLSSPLEVAWEEFKVVGEDLLGKASSASCLGKEDDPWVVLTHPRSGRQYRLHRKTGESEWILTKAEQRRAERVQVKVKYWETKKGGGALQRAAGFHCEGFVATEKGSSELKKTRAV